MRLLEVCPLCSGRELREAYVSKDPHYAISGSHRLVRCTSCSLVFLNPMYSDEELEHLYPADYYAYQEEATISEWKSFAKKALGYWQGTRDPQFGEPGTFLDIGCGSGTFVERMRARGWEAYGVEINKAAARVGQSRGLQIFGGTLQEAAFSSNLFDYIRACHSFEHISCPHETLAEIWRVLKPGGKLLLAVPNVQGLNARIFKRYWWHLCPPVHTFNYSDSTLTRMVKDHHFAVDEVTFNSAYEGLLGSLQIWMNRHDGKRSTEGQLFNIRTLRVLCGWLQHVSDILRLGDMIEVTASKKTGVHPAVHIRCSGGTSEGSPKSDAA